MQNIIKKNRKRLKLTQAAMALELGCERSTIASYESGHIIPSLPMAQKMARLFGITLDELTKDEEALEPVTTTP